MNMVKLLSQYPAGLEMSEVVPRYAKQFEFIVVKNFGHKKLQTLLESEMGDLVQVGVDTHARTHTCTHERTHVCVYIQCRSYALFYRRCLVIHQCVEFF